MKKRSQLKFASLAAKKGRPQIASQVIKKILPTVDLWCADLKSDDWPSSTSDDIRSLKTVELNVLYKHIKHNIIPTTESEKGMLIMRRFAEITLELRLNPNENTAERRKPDESLLQARVEPFAIFEKTRFFR